MSLPVPTVVYIGLSPVVSVAALRPELPEQRRSFEVVVIVPREDGGEPLVPYSLPPELLGCWPADQVIVSATSARGGRRRLAAAVEELVPEMTRAARAAVMVRVAAGDCVAVRGTVRDRARPVT
jgi:hypothetical protein